MSKCLPFFQKKSLVTKFKDFFQNIGLQKCNKNAQGGHFWQILIPGNYPDPALKIKIYLDPARTRKFGTRTRPGPGNFGLVHPLIPASKPV